MKISSIAGYVVHGVILFGRTTALGFAVVSCAVGMGSSTALATNKPSLMTVPGKSNVDANGAFTYSIPITVPPGTAGLVPELSLSYSSRNGDGILGLGWDLGLSVDAYGKRAPAEQPLPTGNAIASAAQTATYSGSAGASASSAPGDIYPQPSTFDFPAPITRCPRTVAQDGIHGSVNYDANDRFCLNGQRLILISGTYGQNGSQYRTEIESFSKIIAHGQAGNGPAWFEVHTKSGQVIQFGNTANSQAPVVPTNCTSSPVPPVCASGTVRVWAINQISDVQGNYLTVVYNNGSHDTTNGQIYPTQIDYTGNTTAGTSPYNSVCLFYNTTQTRPDVVPVYQAGSVTRTTVLLTDVQTRLGTGCTQSSTLVFDYRLSYRLATSAATHDELNSVTLCDINGKCLAPTTFVWQGTRDTLTYTANPGAIAPFVLTSGVVFGALKGDGLTDYLAPSNNPSGSCTAYLQNGDGTFSSGPVTIENKTSVAPSCPVMGQDVDGDGLLDFAFANCPTATSINCSGVLFNLGAQSGGGLLLNQITNANLNGPPNSTLFPSFNPPGEFNGDGRGDLLGFAYCGWCTFVPYLSSGDGTYTPTSQYGTFAEQGLVGSVDIIGDFDGDGCSDIMLASTEGGVGYSGSTTYLCNPAVSKIATPLWNGNQTVITGDFNGDGKTDLLVLSAGANSVLYLSTGTGFVATTIPNSSWRGTYTVVTGDWNNDGKTDIALVPSSATAAIQVYLSTGTGFALSTTIPANGTAYSIAVPADWNSDGATDLSLTANTTTPIETEYVFSYVPELISSVNNGIGAVTYVTYDRINKNQPLYTKCPNNPGIYVCSDAYPTQAVDGPVYVASRLDASNGLGTCTGPGGSNCYSTTYSYGGAKNDLSGRGWLGFAQWSKADLQTGIVITRQYDQTFPYIGYLASETDATTAASTGCTAGVTLRNITNTPGSVNFGETLTFVYTSQTVTVANDCNGAALPTITTTNTYDCQSSPSSCYGELLTGTLSRPDGSSQTVTNTYSNDTADWCFDRPAAVVENSIVGSSNITRTTDYSWTTCLLRQQVMEPSSSTLQLMTSYTPDDFGNMIETETSGSNITSRSTSASYDSLGEFLATTTNEYGYVDHYAHDARFGDVTSHTDPNSVATTWTYDTFGRNANETRPDGTETQSAFAYCSGVNGGTASCVTNGAYERQETPTASNGTTQIGPMSTSYFDMLARDIAHDSQGFNGSAIRVSTPYDALGRIADNSRPYFTSCTPQPQCFEYTANSYDALARIKTASAPNGEVITTAYNGLVISVQVTQNSATILTTTTTKNDEDQIASMEDAAGNTTNYQYDAFNNLAEITDPASHHTIYTYDIRGHRLTSNDPDMGYWQYGYDVLGETTNQIDAKGNSATLGYDLENRLTNRTEPDLTSSWVYDTAAHGVGKLASASTTAGYNRALSYDSLSRPIGTSLTIGGANYVYADTYNSNNGQLATVAYPSGFTAQYDYTSLGYLSQIVDSASGTAYWTVNARDAELHLTQGTAGNSVVTNQAFYAPTGWLAYTQAGVGGGTGVANLAYGFDLIGNLTSRADAKESVSEVYCYDLLNRLVNSATGASGASVSTCTSSGTNITDKTVAFDALGDITSKNDVGMYSYGSGAGPHAVTSIAGTVNGLANPTFAYDLNGNMTSGAGRTIAYTSYNLTSTLAYGSTNLGFTYDTEHGRIIQTSSATGTTTYLNDPVSGAMEEKAVNGTTTTWNDYVRMLQGETGGTATNSDSDPSTPVFAAVPDAGNLIALRTTSPSGGGATWGAFNWGATNWSGLIVNVDYFTLDHLGSISAIAGTTGSVSERDSYDAWGRRRTQYGNDITGCTFPASQTTKGFTSQEMMDAVCTINLNARVYEPTIARFMAADPITSNEYDLQSLNRYTYVNNRPLDLTDPTGLASFLIFRSVLSFGNHSFVVVTNANGSVRKMFSYGPQSNDTLNPGKLVEEQGNPSSLTTKGDLKAWKDGTGVTERVDLNKLGITDDAAVKAGNKVDNILGTPSKPGPTDYAFAPGDKPGDANSNSGAARVLEEAKPGSSKTVPLPWGLTPGFDKPEKVGTSPPTTHPKTCPASVECR